ncbi:hypothetical protein KFK09_026041 [Dendrobium nobile]|uniref:Uncharacterized protein n=1 Tax=Dendrobium nobile TaxID=94219 RepID=A0A8T3A791_DENNO|nr:hypothetical protein KFK09_026041 [Dendrobium nobile]
MTVLCRQLEGVKGRRFSAAPEISGREENCEGFSALLWGQRESHFGSPLSGGDLDDSPCIVSFGVGFVEMAQLILLTPLGTLGLDWRFDYAQSSRISVYIRYGVGIACAYCCIAGTRFLWAMAS